MLRHYLLEGRRVVQVEVDLDRPETLHAWALAWGALDRQIAFDRLPLATVSTVFLGIDHGLWDEGPPRIFETMVFGPSGAEDPRR